jgi:hypothetical protein
MSEDARTWAKKRQQHLKLLRVQKDYKTTGRERLQRTTVGMEAPDDNNDRMECVGSLLVHSHDLQELSDLTTTTTRKSDHVDVRNNSSSSSSSSSSSKPSSLISSPVAAAAAVSSSDFDIHDGAASVLLPPFDFTDFVHHHRGITDISTNASDDCDHAATTATTTITTTTTTTKNVQKQQSTSNGPDDQTTSNNPTLLLRRITNKLQGPAPDDAEAELWAD